MHLSHLSKLFLATGALAHPVSEDPGLALATTTETSLVVVTAPPSTIEGTTLAALPDTTAVEIVTVQETAVVTVVAPTAGTTALPKALVMTLVNRLDDRLVLSFKVGKNKDQKDFESAYGHPGVQALQKGESAVYAFPPDWDGNIEVGYEENVDNSLIEGNTMTERPDYDVSFVQGYSVPIVCSNDGRVVTGCNKQLFNYGICPPGDMRGTRVCHNPVREPNAASAAPFFSPCQSAAITFPTDGGNFNAPLSAPRNVTCCIGDETVCPANENQPRI